MKTEVRAVVIGGGVVGCSILYHLAKIGWSDVVLLDKNQLTSGSTWHAAGGMHTFNGDANVSKLQKYTIDLYRELEELTGQSCGIHHNGGLMLAANEGEMDYLRLVASRARYLSMETEIIPVAEAKRRNVLIEEKYFTGALWRSDGGHVDPWGTTHAYAAAARKLGAEVYQYTKVTGLSQRPDGSWDVSTDKGSIHAEHVVNAGGLWAREVGRMVGIELPVLAMEHHYIVTDAIPELEGLEREIINTTDFSGEIYVRQEGKGALLGTYEHNCTPWSVDHTPDDFHTQLLPDNFDRIAPELEVGFEHFPAVGRAGIKKSINGPFTFAPDGNPLVGPVKGLPNFWVACAVMAGFSQGGGIGLTLSRWMAEGDPGADIMAMDVARFGIFATPRYTKAKVIENYRRRFRLAFPNEELPDARPLRRTPIYGRLEKAGAVFGANFGLEHALWFAPEGVELTENPTYRRSNAFPHVKAECLAVREAVGIYETSNYGKYEIEGKGARAWLDKLLACKLPKPGRMAIAPMLNKEGRIVGDLSVACLDRDRYLLIGSGFAEAFHMRWFWLQNPPADVHVRSAASTLTGFSVAGPNARTLMQRLVREDLSPDAFKLFAVKETAVGLSPVIFSRAGFTGELGYEMWTTPDFQATLYDEIFEAGRDLGLKHFGGRALSSLRLEKAYGSFNKDFRPDYTPAETGLDLFVDFKKEGFTGRDAVLAEREKGPKKRFAVLEVDTDTEVIGYEPILKRGEVVGHVTSGGYGHYVSKSLAIGYVKAEHYEDGGEFAIDIFGEDRPAILRKAPLHDPNGGRLRG
ncbi:glycine cleavage system protein T [Labrys miyagiensis]|uniref:Glycine cleavage system protein T n=1 Tax=Labrys miyagiensis TaxID=346912 RepID=A0ABQ6CNM7_9HYPH|nr:FAD-dependent oxidoreductase [Labrys miyagiensis]GLS21943.1 glycine cleavage system protein T [Labrys miyagiensis]